MSKEGMFFNVSQKWRLFYKTSLAFIKSATALILKMRMASPIFGPVKLLLKTDDVSTEAAAFAACRKISACGYRRFSKPVLP